MWLSRRTQRHCPAHTQLCMCSCLLISRCLWRRKKYQSSSSVMPVPLSPSSSPSLPSHPPILPSRAPTVGFTNCRRGWETLLPLFLLSIAIWFTSLPLAIICSFCPFSFPLFSFSPSYSSVSLHPATPSPSLLFPSSLVLSYVFRSLRSFSFTACPWTHSSFPDTFTLLLSPLPLSVYHSANLHKCVYNLDVTRHFFITGHEEKFIEGKEKWTTENSLSLHMKRQLGWIVRAN